MPQTNPQAAPPLKLPVFHILLALSEQDHHGLGIASEVEDATGGTVRLGPGTLYRTLKEMTSDGLALEVPAPSDDEDPRRKFYRISEAGRQALRGEASRYERIVEVARKRDVLPQAR